MRVCALLGCGKPLTKKNGTADFRKHWCSPEHKNIDRREAMEARRSSVHGRKCRLCGRRPPKDKPPDSGVPRDNPPRRSLVADLAQDRREEIRLRSERLIDDSEDSHSYA